jgi:hypothetical protein
LAISASCFGFVSIQAIGRIQSPVSGIVGFVLVLMTKKQAGSGGVTQVNHACGTLIADAMFGPKETRTEYPVTMIRTIGGSIEPVVRFVSEISKEMTGDCVISVQNE